MLNLKKLARALRTRNPSRIFVTSRHDIHPGDTVEIVVRGRVASVTPTWPNEVQVELESGRVYTWELGRRPDFYVVKDEEYERERTHQGF